jgi:hypothetical protein
MSSYATCRQSLVNNYNQPMPAMVAGLYLLFRPIVASLLTLRVRPVFKYNIRTSNGHLRHGLTHLAAEDGHTPTGTTSRVSSS